jgi:large subunit ribosomal protein L10
MPTPRKSEQIDKIKAAFDKSGAVYFADLSRLKAVEMTDLRRKLRKGKVRLMVVKNRLARKALTDAGIPADLAAIMRGPTSIVLANREEPYSAARVLKDASQRYKEWKFKGAFIEQALYSAEQFDLLAGMPTKTELHSQLVGVLMGPLYQLTMVLEDIMGSFVRVLDEVKEKRAGEKPA